MKEDVMLHGSFCRSPRAAALAFALLAASPLPAQELSTSARDQIQALLAEKEARTPAQRKIDSVVLRAVRERHGLPMAVGVALVPAGIADASGNAVLDLKADVTPALLSRVASLGGTVLSSFPAARSLRVRMPLLSVETLAEETAVTWIGREELAELEREPVPAGIVDADRDLPPGFAARAARVSEHLRAALRSLGASRRPLVGSTQSEGDATHGAATARSTYGYDGTGIRIGVLSDSVDGLAASQASGNLGTVTVLPGQSGVPGSGEGTAMLEIVHDVAPGAQLFFATAFGGVSSFAANIQALRGAPYSCDIIVDDVFYYSESPFQDAPIAQAVNTVTAAGALYFSSAGNAGSVTNATAGVWEGDFVSGGPVAAPVTGTGTLHSFGVNAYDSVTGAGNYGTLFWSDPLGGSTNDYDLFVLNSTGTSVTDSSTNAQTGTQDPFEITAGTLASGARLVVVQRTGAANRFLHLNSNRGRLAVSTGGQTKGHSCAASAFGTAATPAATPFGATPTGPYPGLFTGSNATESFSSDGPRRMFYDASGTPYTPGDLSSTGGTVRSKPDITAADGVTTSVSGFAPFYGTSAAAPHAAAIAALVKQAGPAQTPAQIRSTLTSTAIDIMAAGSDVNSGAGIVMANAAVASLTPTAVGNAFVSSYAGAEGSGNNGNGWVDPGENMNVAVTLQNGGAANIDSVTGTLSLATAVPGVVVVNPGPFTFGSGTLTPGTSASTASPFAVYVSSSVACGQQIDFLLTATYTGGATGSSPATFGFSVKTGPPPIAISSTLDATAPSSGTMYTATTGLTASSQGRLSRNGVSATCSGKTCPGTFGAGTQFRYDAYTITNPSSSPACVTVTLTNNCTGSTATAMLQAVYSPTFDPANLCTNYLGDAGSSMLNGAPIATSVTVPAGASFVVVVMETGPGAAASSCTYSVTISDLPYCAAATPVVLRTYAAE